ncbi:unnamed protein product [Diatraea saccharalis]|uniref:Zinc finger PHD-type domain-containing protein n=1 Tax=Diatraea saccharalis TaxID=40085 RepID=A0A9N9R8U0_9NEOP|nr:unnamed protein product [Diatraea saccharalis]
MANICAGCKQIIQDRRFLICSQCQQNYDLECANVSQSRFYKTMTSEHKSSWKCPLCFSKKPKGDNENTPVRPLNVVKKPETRRITISPNLEDDRQNVTIRKRSQTHNESSILDESDLTNSPQGNTLLTLNSTENIENKQNDIANFDKTDRIHLDQINSLIQFNLQQNNTYIISEIQTIIQKEIERSFTLLKLETKTCIENIDKKQFELEQRIKSLEEECASLRNEMKITLNKIDNTKRSKFSDAFFQNERFLVLHGLSFYDWETEYDLTERVKNVFFEILNIDLTGYIEELSYIGKKGHTRPIKIELISKKMKKYLLENYAWFKNTGLGITEYLDETTLRERKLLKQALKTARQSGQQATIRNNKLIINGQEIKMKTSDLNCENKNHTSRILEECITSKHTGSHHTSMVSATQDNFFRDKV